ncbi:MAG: nucleotide pyrophosphohydrolase [Candidatus Bathyarchaeia archaeon]
MGELTVNQAQKIVDEWVAQFEEGYWPPLSMLAALVEEVGELAREINARERIKRKKDTEPEVDIGLEMADVLFSLICLANHYGVDLEDKFKEVMEKYSERDMGRWTKRR